MKKLKSAVKATNPKMVPEREAVESLCQFAGKVISANRITRRMVADYFDGKDDPEFEGALFRALTFLVIEDEEGREDYVNRYADKDFMMELYDLAMDIREILGLNEFDDLETKNI